MKDLIELFDEHERCEDEQIIIDAEEIEQIEQTKSNEKLINESVVEFEKLSERHNWNDKQRYFFTYGPEAYALKYGPKK